MVTFLVKNRKMKLSGVSIFENTRKKSYSSFFNLKVSTVTRVVDVTLVALKAKKANSKLRFILAWTVDA